MTKHCSTIGMAGLVALVLLACLPGPATAQQYYPPEDTTYFEDEYFDEYYEGEFYEEEYEGEFYDEGIWEEEGYFGEEEFYYEEEGEYLEGDEFYFDEEGFDETFEGEFLEELEPEERVGELDLADDQAGEVELQEIERPIIKEPRVIRGYTAKVSVASPWLVGLGFDAFWYSYIDARLSLDLPRKKGAGRLAPAYTLEVATFSFVNDHPRGGQFRGVALQALMRLPVRPLEISAGGGMYASGSDIRGGMIFGTSYTIPFIRFIAITLESRLTYIQNATPTGTAYWLDVGGSIGYPF